MTARRTKLVQATFGPAPRNAWALRVDGAVSLVRAPRQPRPVPWLENRMTGWAQRKSEFAMV